MAAELAATVAQIARTTADVLRATTSSSLAVLAREGTNPHLLAWLAGSTADLVPNAPLIDGLAVSHALEGKWNSPFMANFLGLQQETTQHALLKVPSGRSLVIYVTALAAAETSITVRGLLREHLALTLGLSHVGEIPENIYHACVHPHTLQLLQEDI